MKVLEFSYNFICTHYLKSEFLKSCTLKSGLGWQSWMIIFSRHLLDYSMPCLYFWIPLFHWAWEYLRIMKTMNFCLAINPISQKVTLKKLKNAYFGKYSLQFVSQSYGNFTMGKFHKIIIFSHATFQEWWHALHDFPYNLVEHVYIWLLCEMESEANSQSFVKCFECWCL